MQLKRAHGLLACAGLLVQMAAAVPLGAQTNPPRPGSELTAIERDQARQIAQQEIARQKLRTDDRIYAVDYELIVPKDEKGEAGSQRLARVTHYRYDGNLAIVSYVDLTARIVVRSETLANPAVPVSQEEFELAKQLLLKDAEVQRLLAKEVSRVVPEALLMHFPDDKDPLFGHRVLRFVFRQGTQYLRQPVVWVDLTARTVTIEKLNSDPAMAH